MKIKVYIIYMRILFTLLTVMFFSCSFFSETDTVNFYLPDEGPWIVQYADIENECRSFITDSSVFSLELFPNMCCGVTASKESLNLGAIYPFTVRLKMEDYFSSSVILSMTSGSVESAEYTRKYLSRFNWKKFMDLCRDYKTEELDKEKIMRKIASGAFKKTDLTGALLH